MPAYPAPLRKLIEAFLVLPGIGRRTAERFAFAMIEGNPATSRQLAESLLSIHAELTACGQCGQLTESDPCRICLDSKRNKQELYVVADSRDIQSLEQTGVCQGLYFVLGGLLNPLERHIPVSLRIDQLMNRLRQGEVREMILALSPTTEGDATALYLAKTMGSLPVKLTRLARGLSTGSRLEYADEATLKSAYLNRQNLTVGSDHQ